MPGATAGAQGKSGQGGALRAIDMLERQYLSHSLNSLKGGTYIGDCIGFRI